MGLLGSDASFASTFPMFTLGSAASGLVAFNPVV
jgi:hypothetical protein